MHLQANRALPSARRTHYILVAALWSRGWMIPVVIMTLAGSIPIWRGAISEVEVAVANQIDYEDGELCAKWGFAPATRPYQSCKMDLLDLRHRHEKLLAASALP